MTTEEEVAYLRSWAADNKAYFEDEGECGFGRECVGIVAGNSYPSYTEYEQLNNDPWLKEIHSCPEASPPDGVEDAYHKHDCLAVLGRGPKAIRQLYIWVKNLEAQGIVIRRIPRRPSDGIDAAIHGLEVSVLEKPDGAAAAARTSCGARRCPESDDRQRDGGGTGPRLPRAAGGEDVSFKRWWSYYLHEPADKEDAK